MRGEENRSLMLRTDGWWRILQHSDTNKRVDLSRGEGWRRSALVFINNPSVRWASNNPQRWSCCPPPDIGLLLSSSAHENASHAPHTCCTNTTRLTSRQLQRRRGAVRPEPGAMFRADHVTDERRHIRCWLSRKLLCLWILRGGIKLPRGAGGQQHGEKNIMKLKTSSRLVNAKNRSKKTGTHFITLDSSFT